MTIPEGFSPAMAPPSARWMGMDLIDVRPDEMYAKVSFEPNKDMINFGGTIQGGILSAMMDDAMGFNAFIGMQMKMSMATIDLHTHFYKAVKMEKVIVEARVIRAGKSVAFSEAKLFDSSGELAAAATTSVKLRAFAGMQFDASKQRGNDGLYSDTAKEKSDG